MEVEVVELRVENGAVIEKRKTDYIPDEKVRDCLLCTRCKVTEPDYPKCRERCIHYKNHLAIESSKKKEDKQ